MFEANSQLPMTANNQGLAPARSQQQNMHFNTQQQQMFNNRSPQLNNPFPQQLPEVNHQFRPGTGHQNTNQQQQLYNTTQQQQMVNSTTGAYSNMPLGASQQIQHQIQQQHQQHPRDINFINQHPQTQGVPQHQFSGNQMQAYPQQHNTDSSGYFKYSGDPYQIHHQQSNPMTYQDQNPNHKSHQQNLNQMLLNQNMYQQQRQQKPQALNNYTTTPQQIPVYTLPPSSQNANYYNYQQQQQQQQQQYPQLPFYPGNPQAFYHQQQQQQQQQQQLQQQQQQQQELCPEDTYYQYQQTHVNEQQFQAHNNIVSSSHFEAINANMGSNLSHGSSNHASGNLTDKEVVAFRFQDKDYNIFGEALINDYEANQIYSKLLQESRFQGHETQSSHGSGSGGLNTKKNTSSWRDDETHLLQWSVFTYALQKNSSIEEFTENDWGNVAEFIPTRDKIKCLKRWLFIQKLGGNKSQWTKREDEALSQIVEQEGAKEWTKIADTLNSLVGTNRNGKQCRERWNNTLNPGIKKGKWTVQEDLVLLEKQKELGNKWSEISHYLNGRTENQIKNRFNCLVRKGQQQKSIDSNTSLNQIIDKMIIKFKGQIQASQFKRHKQQSMKTLTYQQQQQYQQDPYNPQFEQHNLLQQQQQQQILKRDTDEMMLISSVDGGDDDHINESYSGIDEDEDGDGDFMNDEEELGDDDYMEDFTNQVDSQNQVVFSDLNIALLSGGSNRNSKVGVDENQMVRMSPASNEEIKTQSKLNDFQQLHEHSFKVSSEGKKKGMNKVAAHKTKNLLMNLVRQDSQPKLNNKRKNSKLNTSGSLEKHKHSRSLSKQGLTTGTSTFKKSNFQKSRTNNNKQHSSNNNNNNHQSNLGLDDDEDDLDDNSSSNSSVDMMDQNHHSECTSTNSNVFQEFSPNNGIPNVRNMLTDHNNNFNLQCKDSSNIEFNDVEVRLSEIQKYQNNQHSFIKTQTPKVQQSPKLSGSGCINNNNNNNGSQTKMQQMATSSTDGGGVMITMQQEQQQQQQYMMNANQFDYSQSLKYSLVAQIMSNIY